MRPFLFTSEMFIRLLVVEAALRVAPFERLVNRLSRSRCWVARGDLKDAWRYAAGLNRRLFPDPSCLRVTLAVYSWAQDGVCLRIGVDRSTIRSEAHAWLEEQGSVYSTNRDWPSYREILSMTKGKSEVGDVAGF